MRIQLISHSSVITTTEDTVIWCDPWLVSKVFNESWTLYPEPAFDESMLEPVEYLWISHEHPDHFNVPTLRMLPDHFKARVTVLFQKNNSSKVFEALRTFGFQNFVALPHREIHALTPKTEVYCYQVGQMDSCLGIRSGDALSVNVNDATVSPSDSKLIRDDLGQATVVLNQFATAGYAGLLDRGTHLRKMAQEHLELLITNHRDLGARATIPFASYMVYSRDDNKYMNEFSNRPRDVADRLKSNSFEAAVLYPGDVWDSERPYDSEPALQRFDEAYEALDDFVFDPVEPVPFEDVREAFEAMSADLRAKYPALLLGRLGPMTAHIPDLAKSIRFSLATGELEEIDDDDTDMVVNSQPLQFAFAFPYGVQTLGVSSRLVLRKNEGNWAKHRVLLSLYNAELYLKPRYFLSRNNLRFLMERRHGLVRQAQMRFAHMREGF
jgi:UDP-MurNAc hydroxylase